MNRSTTQIAANFGRLADGDWSQLGSIRNQPAVFRAVHITGGIFVASASKLAKAR